MSPAASPTLSSDRSPIMVPAAVRQQAAAVAAAGVISPMADLAAKDAIIAWYRGEFAAANAIIDALCNHLAQLNSCGGSSSEYEAAFAAIHQRRLNWIPVLQMQKYFPIAEVVLELQKVAAAKKSSQGGGDEEVAEGDKQDGLRQSGVLKDKRAINNGNDNVRDVADQDSLEIGITANGSQEVQATPERVEICDNHEDCGARHEQIKMTKGFIAKEPVKGHMVNVVKGLKMFEDIFTISELCKLNDFVDELRTAGQNGELLGETYILFNKHTKGNKTEQIQLGVPLFRQIKDEASNEQQRTNIEPIPELLQSVIDHLVHWQIIPENRKPNGCTINYFDEPFLKPPHLDQPICTLLLSESTIAFGRTLISDNDGNFKGQLVLSVKRGSLLVMRNNSADMARHAVCPSPARKVSITFFRVRTDTDDDKPSTTAGPFTPAMMLGSGFPSPTRMPNGPGGDLNVLPKCRIIPNHPMVMLAPIRPMVLNPSRRMQRGGTGVFLPWAIGSTKMARHLPPRAQKGRLLALPSTDAHVSDTTSDPGVDGPKVV